MCHQVPGVVPRSGKQAGEAFLAHRLPASHAQHARYPSGAQAAPATTVGGHHSRRAADAGARPQPRPKTHPKGAITPRARQRQPQRVDAFSGHPSRDSTSRARTPAARADRTQSGIPSPLEHRRQRTDAARSDACGCRSAIMAIHPASTTRADRNHAPERRRGANPTLPSTRHRR